MTGQVTHHFPIMNLLMVEFISRVLIWGLAVSNLPVDLAEAILLLGITIWSPIIVFRDGLTLVAWRIWHAFASGAALWAFANEPGAESACFAAVWLLWAMTYAVRQCHSVRFRSGRCIERAVAAGFLLVSATWFVCARSGFSPFGFPIGITLLTSVHFLFGGWLLPMLIDRHLQCIERSQDLITSNHASPSLVDGKHALRLVLATFPIVAIGMLCEPIIELLGVTLLLTAVGVFLLLQHRLACRQSSRINRLAAGVAAQCGFIGFSLAATFAVAEFRNVIVIPIPTMIATHGVIVSVGVIGSLIVATRDA